MEDNAVDRSYLPAAGHDRYLWLYDPMMRVFGFRRAARALIEQAQLQPHQALLDIGCGTGTLAVMIKRRQPTVYLVGLDPDPKALAIAEKKAHRARMNVRFERGFANALPYKDAAFDRVFSSMMFHHLKKEERQGVLAEIRRVLKPAGRLELLDFAGRHHSLLGGLVHRHQPPPAAADTLLERMRDAGFASADRIAGRRTVFGPIAFYQARA